MTINIRKRKQGKSSKVAIYLEIYKGRSIDANGNILTKTINYKYIP